MCLVLVDGEVKVECLVKECKVDAVAKTAKNSTKGYDEPGGGAGAPVPRPRCRHRGRLHRRRSHQRLSWPRPQNARAEHRQKQGSLEAIVHAVDTYDMPAGLRLSYSWHEPVENSTLEYEYTLDGSARYEGTCFLSFVNLAYDQQQGVYRLSPEDAATLEEVSATHREKENDENDENDDDD